MLREKETKIAEPLSSKSNDFISNILALFRTDGLVTFEQSSFYAPTIFANEYIQYCPSNAWFNFCKSLSSRGTPIDKSSSNNINSISNNNNMSSLKRKQLINSSSGGKRRIKHSLHNLWYFNGKEIVIPPNKVDSNNYDKDNRGKIKITSLILLKTPKKTKPCEGVAYFNILKNR